MRAPLWLCVFALLGVRSIAAQDPAAMPHPEITVRPGDVIRVQIWREEDLSGEFPVDRGGVVTLPLLGDRRVGGLTVDATRDSLIEAYRSQLRNPSILIVPLRRVNILGEVSKPGVYLIDPTTTLAGAVALAGGISAAGSPEHIRIIRAGEVVRRDLHLTEPVGTAEVQSGDEIVVDRTAWAMRNLPFMFSAVLSVTGILIGLLR